MVWFPAGPASKCEPFRELIVGKVAGGLSAKRIHQDLGGDVVRDFLHDEVLSGDEKVLNRYVKPDLVLVDDMGLKSLPRKSGEILFEIIMRRYENRSTMMTSNRPIEEWQLLGDVPSATAILDRFLHHAGVIAISGKSYRQRKDNSGSSEPDSDPKPANVPTGSPAKKQPKSSAPKPTDEAA